MADPDHKKKISSTALHHAGPEAVAGCWQIGAAVRQRAAEAIDSKESFTGTMHDYIRAFGFIALAPKMTVQCSLAFL